MIRTQGIYLRLHQLRFGLAISAFLIGLAAAAIAQQRALQLDPAQTSVKFTLGDVLHTVHGTFQLKRGTLEFAPDAGKLSGEILVDAASGSSGSGMRDHKMNKEVLETSRYPEIVFHPDRIEGTVAAQGKSSVRVHGMFNIHGVDREITVPAEVGTLHFAVPYANWGMKNPSTLFLKVNDSVEIDLTAVGNVVTPSIAKTAQ